MTPRWILPIVAMLMLGGSVSVDAGTIQIAMENLVWHRPRKLPRFRGLRWSALSPVI
jgi:hypothetical protein